MSKLVGTFPISKSAKSPEVKGGNSDRKGGSKVTGNGRKGSGTPTVVKILNTKKEERASTIPGILRHRRRNSQSKSVDVGKGKSIVPIDDSSSKVFQRKRVFAPSNGEVNAAFEDNSKRERVRQDIIRRPKKRMRQRLFISSSNSPSGNGKTLSNSLLGESQAALRQRGGVVVRKLIPGVRVLPKVRMDYQYTF